MAIIDTLKLARALSSKGGFSIDAAEATAEALNAALGEGVPPSQARAVAKADINRLEGKLTVMMWVIGINAAATVTMLIKHW